MIEEGTVLTLFSDRPADLEVVPASKNPGQRV